MEDGEEERRGEGGKGEGEEREGEEGEEEGPRGTYTPRFLRLTCKTSSTLFPIYREKETLKDGNAQQEMNREIPLFLPNPLYHTKIPQFFGQFSLKKKKIMINK